MSEQEQQIMDKISELIELSADDPNTQIVMLALKGAKLSGDDKVFAILVQRIVSEVLLPLLEERERLTKINLN